MARRCKVRGRGRPSFLVDPIVKNIRFESKHIELLEKYAARHNLSGYTEAIRDILDTYDFS